jgi:antitoxin component of MazEF toxin-antitoxin module
MNTTVQKWGNSLALRIPQAVAKQIRVEEGDAVRLEVGPDGLNVRPARPRYRLADLVRRMKTTAKAGETDWGKPRGREVW